jgi:NAD/NADP transhydrogenase beta subunit
MTAQRGVRAGEIGMVLAGQNLVNLSLLAVAIVLAVYLVWHPGEKHLIPLMVEIPLVFGVLMVIPIGGADMPPVLSLLNSYAGLSAAATLAPLSLNNFLRDVVIATPRHCLASKF